MRASADLRRHSAACITPIRILAGFANWRDTRKRYSGLPLHGPEMPDRSPRRDCFRGGGDGVRVDAVVAVEFGDRAGLAEMLDPERADTVAGDRAEPTKRRRVAVDHGDQG